MGSGRPPTPTRSWVCEPVIEPGAGARPGRVTHCCFEHAGQNFGSLDRGPRAIRLMNVRIRLEDKRIEIEASRSGIR